MQNYGRRKRRGRKMSDEWNIKDKISEYNPNHTSGYPRVYYEEDVETLRKKLIEDIKNAVEVYSREWLMNVAIERTINKRFGVEK
jgi:hypothetical protein